MTDSESFNKHILLKGKDIIPLMQGGMGVGVSFSGLAGAVASCGAIGIISTAQAGFAEPDFETNTLQSCLRAIDKQIKRAKEIAQGRGLVGVNVMTALRHYKEHVAQAVRSGADVIVCGAGLPLDLPGIVCDECEAAGVEKPLIAPIVSSQRAAKLILKHWYTKYNDSPDIVVVEGPLAGGHLGYTKDEAQNPAAVDFYKIIKEVSECVKEYSEKFSKKILIAAGGGIYTKEDASKILGNGADMIQVASRFVATYECDAAQEYKNAYINATQKDIQIIKSPVGMPGRAIRNKFVQKIEKENIPVKKCLSCLSHCNPSQIPYCITNALINAVKGDVDNGLIFCGGSVGSIGRLQTVKDVIEELGINVSQ